MSKKKVVKKSKTVKSSKMVFKKTWEEFRNTGFLWLVNSFLHIFGWSIVFEFDENNKVVDVYPARVKFRGFSEDMNSKGYLNITRFMQENAETLLKEAKE